MAKATNLLKAYLNNDIPAEGGFIISAFFQPGSTYAVYEATAYRNVKDIFRDKDGVMFRTDGNRAHMLVEPPSYSKKHVEPVHRDEGKSIPYRLNELNLVNSRKGGKVLISQEPMLIHSSFTILEHASDSFAFLFYLSRDVYVAIKKFIADSLYNDCDLSKPEAMEAATHMLDTIKKFAIWQES